MPNRPLILIVDDDAKTLAAVRLYLEHAGAMGGFMLPAELIDCLPLAAAPRVVGKARTVSNEFEIREASLAGTVRLGGHEFAGATVGFQPVFPMANVGSRVLRDFVVTFDQKNGRVRFRKPV